MNQTDEFINLKNERDNSRKEIRQLKNKLQTLQKEFKIKTKKLQSICKHNYVRECTTSGCYAEYHYICQNCYLWR